MSRRCLICSNINPCRDHISDAQDAELSRNLREIRDIQRNVSEALIPAGSVPEGWRLVPVKPTDAMVEALLDTMYAISREEGRPALKKAILASPTPPEPEGAKSDEAERGLYALAVMFATRDKASTSYVQRRCGIGFNLAARFMERMEHAGLISSPNNAGYRTILQPWPEAPAQPEARDLEGVISDTMKAWTKEGDRRWNGAHTRLRDMLIEALALPPKGGVGEGEQDHG